MRFRRKACEKILFSLPDDFLKTYKKNSECCSCIEIFESLNSAGDGIQQINFLKEIQKLLSQKTSEQLAGCQSDITILCYAFFQSPLKSSHKKTLNRILHELSNQSTEEVIHSLQFSLQHILDSLLQNLSVKEIDSSTDCLLGLLDNFPIGATVIENMNEVVCKYLSDTLTYIIMDLQKSNYTELYSICQSILKAYTLILQNCAKFSSMEVSKEENMSLYYDRIVNSIKYLLSNEQTILNCRLNAGIALCYHYYCLDSENFKLNLFQHKDLNFFEGEKFPLSSQLCIFSGIMAALPNREFVSTQNGKIIADEVIQKILHISESIGDSDLLLLCARDLIQWSNIMSNVLCCKNKQLLTDIRVGEVRKLFQENSLVMEMLFQYVLHYRDHYVDTLRHLSKDLFKIILNLHVLSLDPDQDPHKSPLLGKMTCYLLKDLPQFFKGKYGLLSCIVEIVGTNTVLQWHPSLPDALYNALKEVGLITHVSDLLETLFRKSDFTEVNDNFINIWLKPLLRHLCSDSKEQTTAMNEHVLPKLFKVKPIIVQFLLRELSIIWEKNQGNCFSALIVCVKFRQRQEPNQSALDFISFGSLINALSHADDQVRLSAFALICENPKTTEPVPVEALKLIQITLQYNINCQSPAFRQQLVSCLKKLFNRMDKSRYTMERRKQLNELEKSTQKVDPVFDTKCDYPMERCSQDYRPTQCPSIEETYDNFLIWLKNFLFQSLHPGVNFPRRVTVLNLLSILHSIFSENVSIVSKPAEAQALLYALQDTYENNKITALKVLSSSNSSFFETEIGQFSEALLQTALILSSSSKPPDTVTAAYMFAVMVQYECFKPHIKNHLSELVKKDLGLRCIVEHPTFAVETSSTSFIAILTLAGELLKHLKVAQNSLLSAAAHTPLYGVLACIRSVVSQVEFRLLKDSESLLWSILIQELIVLSIKVAATVEPVVCNSSPEGHLPMDTDSDNIQQLQTAVRRAIGTRFQSAVVESEDPSSTQDADGVVLDIAKTHAVTAQILLLCCWRTHKEVSLLFGEMAEKIPVGNVDDGAKGSLLNVSQVGDIGEYFIRQMTLVKHKGAFEQAFIGFSQLCHMLWRSNIMSLTELPKAWLNDLFLAIRGLKDNMHLCSTRRSAGLPFIVQALLTTDPGLSSSLFFKNTITSFLSMALAKNEDEKQEEKIHALNILRALFRDACLSDVLIPFVSEGLKASITGFKSKSWAVRNSSTLLFSALMTRVFGVSHSQDEAGKKNRLTGRTFFTYYKDTYSFLYNELEHCASVLGKDQNSLSLVPALYPILLILGRLYPAPGDSDPRLASFIPFLQVCGNSAVWKVRVLTAKALVPLISVENIVSTLQSLFGTLPLSEKDVYFQNEIHGKCLQIISILKEVSIMPQDIKKSIENNLKSWIQSCFHIASFNNKCYTTKAAYLEIVLYSITMNTTLDSTLIQQLIAEILLEIRTISASPDKEHYLGSAIILSLLSLIKMEHIQMQELLLQINGKYKFLTNIFEDLLSSPYEVVRCTALQFLVCLFQDRITTDSFDLESSFYPVFFTNLFNGSVCAAIQERREVLREKLQTDPDLSLLVLGMLLKEKSNSCLGHVYQLLSLMPMSVDLPWCFVPIEQNACDCQKLNYVISQLTNCNRDDISNQMLLFSTQVSLKLCKELQERKDNGHSSNCSNCLNVLDTWLTIIKESALPLNCISKRKAVVSAFCLIFQPSTVHHLKILGDNSVNLWQSLACLLIDDEPEIKQLSAEIVISLKAFKAPGDISIPVVSWLALDYLMKLFIEENTCSLPVCIAVFLNWMLSCQRLDADTMGDEQPFDRGELNVFAEDLSLTQLASKHLSQLLFKSNEPHVIIPFRLISCSACIIPNPEFNFDEIVNFCLTESEALVQGLLSRSAVSTFLDTWFDHDMIQLCQRLYVIMCLSSFVILNYKCRGLALLERSKEIKCQTVFINCVFYVFEQHLLDMKDGS